MTRYTAERERHTPDTTHAAGSGLGAAGVRRLRAVPKFSQAPGVCVRGKGVRVVGGPICDPTAGCAVFKYRKVSHISARRFVLYYVYTRL